MTIDALLPEIDAARRRGAMVILKWDGERSRNVSTVVITHQESDFVWRKDSDNVVTALHEAITAFDAHCPP